MTQVLEQSGVCWSRSKTLYKYNQVVLLMPVVVHGRPREQLLSKRWIGIRLKYTHAHQSNYLGE
jgi:hypothetical protein